MNKRILVASITAASIAISNPVYAEGFFSKIFGGRDAGEEQKVQEKEVMQKEAPKETIVEEVNYKKIAQDKHIELKNDIIAQEEFWETYSDNGIIMALDGYQAVNNMLYEEAGELFLSSSEKGVKESRLNLAQLIDKDLVSNELKVKSISELEVGGIDGHPFIQKTLALTLLDTDIIDGRQKEGALWIKRAAESGNLEAQYVYGNMLTQGKIFKQDGQIGIFFLEKMAESTNYPKAYRQIAMAYEEGMGVQRNYELALKNYIKASDVNDIFSTKKAGLMYQNGIGTETNHEKALSYFEKASKAGDSQGTYLWATLYSKDLSDSITEYSSIESWKADENNSKALNALIEAGESGYSLAYRYIGDMYVKMQQLDDNYKEAVKWYEKAADDGDVTSMRRLHNIYMEGGHGVDRNPELAKSYIKNAITTRNNAKVSGDKVEAEYEIFYK